MSTVPSLKQYRDLESAYRSPALKLSRSEEELRQTRAQFRQAVLIPKLTQGSRSDRGSRYMERCLSVVSALRGQGQDVYDFFCRTFEQGLRGKPVPQLPLGD